MQIMFFSNSTVNTIVYKQEEVYLKKHIIQDAYMIDLLHISNLFNSQYGKYYLV